MEYERGRVDEKDGLVEDQDSPKGLWIDFGKHCGRRSCCENKGAKRQAEDCSMGVIPRRLRDFNGSIISRPMRVLWCLGTRWIRGYMQ